MMLGKAAACAVYCLCCNSPRTQGQQRKREEAEWRREVQAESDEP